MSEDFLVGLSLSTIFIFLSSLLSIFYFAGIGLQCLAFSLPLPLAKKPANGVCHQCSWETHAHKNVGTRNTWKKSSLPVTHTIAYMPTV